MKTTDFAECLTSYLTMYLPGQMGLAENTIMSYRDTFKLFFIFIQEKRSIRIERLSLSDFNAELLRKFLTWLETDRGSSIATRNQRLAALRAFAKYARTRKPEFLLEAQKIADIKQKKKPTPTLPHLQPDCIKAIISQTDTTEKFGRRDMVLLCLMYDSGARVQEICDLRIRDIRLDKPYTVTLTGKGNKVRSAPIMANTAEVLAKYLTENKLNTPDKLDYPLFSNHQRQKLTRAGIAYILKKYCDLARADDARIPDKVSPHVLRHSKAMHMLQAGINLVYIRDFLGHASVSTTEVYAKADTETKREAIQSAQIRIDPELPDWAADHSLMAMLMDLCGKN